MQVFIGRSPDNVICGIIETDSLEEAFKFINNKAQNYVNKIYYTRSNLYQDDSHDYIEVDFGSYSYFGYIKNLTKDNWNELLNDIKKPKKPHEKVGTGITFERDRK